MNKVVAIIPARWASTRFPGKALHGIAGKPLVRHVWERCLEADCFDQIVIATDDMRIAEACFNFGAEVAVTAADHASGTDRVAEVEDFVDFLRARAEERRLVDAASRLSEPSLQEVWDNPDDAEYDRL